MKKWLKARSQERTTFDGFVLIMIGLVVLVLGPFAKIAAAVAILYGIITMVLKEK